VVKIGTDQAGDIPLEIQAVSFIPAPISVIFNLHSLYGNLYLSTFFGHFLVFQGVRNMRNLMFFGPVENWLFFSLKFSRVPILLKRFYMGESGYQVSRVPSCSNHPGTGVMYHVPFPLTYRGNMT
jgi:hypothetical protein